VIPRTLHLPFFLGLLLGLPSCAPVTTKDVVGQPLTERERQEAYEVVLTELPDTLRHLNPVLQPAVCLDSGIYASPFGAHVADHDADWLDQMVRDRLVETIADHSPGACPEESYWVALANTELMAGDSVAVPFTIQRIARRGGGQADRTSWRAIVLDDGGWEFVRWEEL
jgi:hypothetical protein